MVMVPTLKLLGYELKKEQVPQFRAFVAAGGRMVFGTDEARAFAKVRCAFRQGKAIYEATRPAR